MEGTYWSIDLNCLSSINTIATSHMHRLREVGDKTAENLNGEMQTGGSFGIHCGIPQISVGMIGVTGVTQRDIELCWE